MGYYINETSKGDPLPAQNKAQCLVACGDASVIDKPHSFEPGIVCVVENSFFDAAAYCFNATELNAFGYNDGRSRTWLKMDDGLARKLSGFV